MIKSLTRFAAVAAVCASLATAQQRSETVPVTTSDPVLVGFEADVYGTNFSSFSLVGYQARVLHLPFGSGTIESVSHSSIKSIEYKAVGFKFGVTPDFTWGAWCAGLGSVEFNVNYVVQN